MSKITHIVEISPYDGKNPNNCDNCGIVSASLIFKAIEDYKKSYSLCLHCRGPMKLSDLGVIPNLNFETLEKLCWYKQRS